MFKVTLANAWHAIQQHTLQQQQHNHFYSGEEIVRGLFEDKDETNVRSRVTKLVVTNSTYRLSLGHFRISRLLRLEQRCQSVLKNALQRIESSKTNEFVHNHPYEVCVYVLRCVLDGFKKGDVVVLDRNDFADLAPMPTQKGLHGVFCIPTDHITKCSLILQEAINKMR